MLTCVKNAADERPENEPQQKVGGVSVSSGKPHIADDGVAGERCEPQKGYYPEPL